MATVMTQPRGSGRSAPMDQDTGRMMTLCDDELKQIERLLAKTERRARQWRVGRWIQAAGFAFMVAMGVWVVMAAVRMQQDMQ